MTTTYYYSQRGCGPTDVFEVPTERSGPSGIFHTFEDCFSLSRSASVFEDVGPRPDDEVECRTCAARRVAADRRHRAAEEAEWTLIEFAAGMRPALAAVR